VFCSEVKSHHPAKYNSNNHHKPQQQVDSSTARKNNRIIHTEKKLKAMAAYALPD
jgi:hypothetical protein